MIIKFLSIFMLIHTAELQFGGLGGLNLPTGNNRPTRPPGGGGLLSGIGTLGNVAASAGSTGGQLASAGLGKILGFGDFKSVFNKTYANEAEEIFRKQIYQNFLQVISDHNDLFKKGIEKFSLATNYFSDWTHSEYIEIMGMDLSEEESDSKSENNEGSKRKRKTRASDNCQSPDTKDWREDGAVTPVKNQLKCASCWAFSAAGALEGQFFLKNGKLNSLSEQQFVDCSKQHGNHGCNKGTMNNAFKYTRGDGIVTDDEYPYEAKDNNCRASPNSMKIKGVESISKGSEEKLKDAVCRIGPVAAALDATDKKFMLYSDGVYFNSDCNPNSTTHAVLVVGYGYDDNTGLEYWLIKNSFGKSWGKDGFGKVARNEKNHCGIANVASYPLV